MPIGRPVEPNNNTCKENIRTSLPQEFNMAKRKKLTEEEIKALNLSTQLKDLRYRAKFIPDPPSHVKYQVGDRVQHGNIDESIIAEVIDDGRIYLLHERNLDNVYGKKVPTERYMYVSWLDIRPYHTKEEELARTTFGERDSAHFQLNFCQMDLFSVFNKFYHFGVDMDPDYQRGNVWSPKDQVELIRSIFLNVDIGKFVFVELPFKENSPAYEILDGKQRLIALTSFYENRFKFQGLYYNELCRRDQSHLKGHPVSLAHVRNESIKLSDKYKYFLRLNTGGKAQDPKHIKAVEALYKQALAEGK